MSSYIYLFELADGKQKVGHTNQIDRLQCGQGKLMKTSRVSTDDVAQIEANIMAELMQTFELAHGSEYFYGDSVKIGEIIERHVI